MATNWQQKRETLPPGDKSELSALLGQYGNKVTQSMLRIDRIFVEWFFRWVLSFSRCVRCFYMRKPFPHLDFYPPNTLRTRVHTHDFITTRRNLPAEPPTPGEGPDKMLSVSPSVPHGVSLMKISFHFLKLAQSARWLLNWVSEE